MTFPEKVREILDKIYKEGGDDALIEPVGSHYNIGASEKYLSQLLDLIESDLLPSKFLEDLNNLVEIHYKGEDEMREWDFDVDSEQVDLDRLHRELSDIPAVVAIAYMQELVRNAPIVYKRYRDREKQRCGDNQIWNWDELDKNLTQQSQEKLK
jgi:hypothetical protein